MRHHAPSSGSAAVLLVALVCSTIAGGWAHRLPAAEADSPAPSTAPARLPPVVPLDAGDAPAVPTARPAPPPLVSVATLGIAAVAIGAILVLRLTQARRTAPLPPDVFDVLGSATIAGHHGVRVVRFGPKTLLVSVSAGGCQTLAELADPQATACIVAACRGHHPPRAPQATAATSGAAAGIGRAAAVLLMMLLSGLAPTASLAAEPGEAVEPAAAAAADLVTNLLGTRSLDSTLSAAVMFGVASLAPAVLLMTTCFVRMSVVLSLLRQGLGTQQLPSNQIVTSLALFLSALVMWPVWAQAWKAGVEPYQQGRIDLREAYEQGTLPVRRWMAGQIEQAGNRDTVLLFLKRHPDAPREVKTYDDVPVAALLPAFLVSELETAFAIGLRLLLPFLVLDVVVATLVVATGLVMLPPSLVSLPLKLLVFVMADGWTLVVQSLLDGFRTAGS